MKNETIDTLAAYGAKTTAVGTGMTGLAWFTSNEFFGLVGATVAIAGLLVTWYYKRESNRREAARHELYMKMLRRGMKPDTDLGELGVDE